MTWSARPGIRHHSPARIHEASDPAALAEAIDEAVAMINARPAAGDPCGRGSPRFGLQELLLALIEKANIPFASTILGKSVIERATSALSGGLRRRDGTRRCSRLCRVQRLRDHARHVHDRHQSRAFIPHGSTPPDRSAPPARNSRFAITPSRMSASRISCAAWCAADLKRREPGHHPHPEKEPEFKVRPRREADGEASLSAPRMRS